MDMQEFWTPITEFREELLLRTSVFSVLSDEFLLDKKIIKFLKSTTIDILQVGLCFFNNWRENYLFCLKIMANK